MYPYLCDPSDNKPVCTTDHLTKVCIIVLHAKHTQINPSCLCNRVTVLHGLDLITALLLLLPISVTTVEQNMQWYNLILLDQVVNLPVLCYSQQHQ